MSELLPCPFCGNIVSVVVLDENELNGCDCRKENPYYAVCCAFNEVTPNTSNWKAGCGATGRFEPTKAEAIAAWNQRAERKVE
jgi:hypothetical protein